MPEIHLLSQSTIDKIAAGEVVERPLSVVKELTENAMDAKATAITVEIKEGGISFIRVTDNGCGIEKAQVKKAFLRHATSKINSIEDLDFVKSLGFRGEALSSIAAVSQMEVITKTVSELTGIRYGISGGCEENLEEIGAPNGTTFIVRNLFFNTPVRKKFLKQPQTEGSYVADLMEHLALSRPDISIKFIQNGQMKFHTSGNGNLKEVIYRIYGKDITDALVEFEMQKEWFSISGFLGKPEINRSNRNFETYFVNGRYTKNDILTKAMEEGYHAYLMQHKFPFYVLNFSVEPELLDVNVHPAKMEIRLVKGNGIYELIIETVKKRLQEIELIPNVKLVNEEEKKMTDLKAPEPFEERRAAVLREESGEYKTAAAFKEFPQGPGLQDFMHKIAGNKILGAENTKSATGNEGLHANIIKSDEHILVRQPSQLQLFEDKFLTREAKEDYRIMGQIFETYWLIAFKDKLFIVDQHAAHEKVKYERLLKELEEKSIVSQMLAPPVIVTLTGREEEVFAEYADYFREMGFESEEFGSGSVAFRSMPADLYGCGEKEFFTDILDQLAETPLKGAPETILQKLASMACKSAVKGNNKMELSEIEALIDELLTLENPYHCPHGRPTIISMSKYEIEKKFKRIV